MHIHFVVALPLNPNWKTTDFVIFDFLQYKYRAIDLYIYIL